MSLNLPPLRERTGDLPLLVKRFLGPDWQIAPEAMQALDRYDWPGNIRQLINAIDRAKILAEDNLITLDDLPDAMQVTLPPAEVSSTDPLNLSELERRTVRAALDEAKGNKAKAAQFLGISRRALYRLIEKYRLGERPVEARAVSK
jgi:DNA-binding NtrC family response regulator